MPHASSPRRGFLWSLRGCSFSFGKKTLLPALFLLFPSSFVDSSVWATTIAAPTRPHENDSSKLLILHYNYTIVANRSVYLDPSKKQRLNRRRHHYNHKKRERNHRNHQDRQILDRALFQVDGEALQFFQYETEQGRIHAALGHNSSSLATSLQVQSHISIHLPDACDLQEHATAARMGAVCGVAQGTLALNLFNNHDEHHMTVHLLERWLYKMLQVRWVHEYANTRHPQHFQLRYLGPQQVRTRQTLRFQFQRPTTSPWLTSSTQRQLTDLLQTKVFPERLQIHQQIQPPHEHRSAVFLAVDDVQVVRQVPVVVPSHHHPHHSRYAQQCAQTQRPTRATRISPSEPLNGIEPPVPPRGIGGDNDFDHYSDDRSSTALDTVTETVPTHRIPSNPITAVATDVELLVTATCTGNRCTPDALASALVVLEEATDPLRNWIPEDIRLPSLLDQLQQLALEQQLTDLLDFLDRIVQDVLLLVSILRDRVLLPGRPQWDLRAFLEEIYRQIPPTPSPGKDQTPEAETPGWIWVLVAVCATSLLGALLWVVWAIGSRPQARLLRREPPYARDQELAIRSNLLRDVAAAARSLLRALPTHGQPGKPSKRCSRQPKRHRRRHSLSAVEATMGRNASVHSTGTTAAPPSSMTMDDPEMLDEA